MHYNTVRYHNRMRLLRERLGGKCVCCGADKELHIHHKDSSEKLFTVASEFCRPMEELFAEVNKCELLCVTCHRDRHKATHGLTRYSHHKCRCSVCKDAWNSYHKELKRRRKSIDGDAGVL